MNITIYIRRDLEDLFKVEKEKSKLINRLLDSHYSSGLKLRDVPLWPELTISEKPKIKSVATATGINPNVPAVPYRSLTVESLLPKMKKSANGNCRIHGTPLDDRNRCLTKGCRYA